MELFVKVVSDIKLLTVLIESSILDVWLADLPTKNSQNLETDFGFHQKLEVFIWKQGDWSRMQSFD